MKGENIKRLPELHAAMRAHFKVDLYEKFGANENYAEYGLTVADKYRGRKIGEYILKAR